MADRLQRLLRHDRIIVAVSLAVVAIACWVYLLMGAGMGMSGFEMTRHTLMKMDMMETATWTPAYFVLMFFMWWLMMVAMMLPSATPMILHCIFDSKSECGQSSANTPGSNDGQ